jgi:hypothetical protein
MEQGILTSGKMVTRGGELISIVTQVNKTNDYFGIDKVSL